MTRENESYLKGFGFSAVLTEKAKLMPPVLSRVFLARAYSEFIYPAFRSVHLVEFDEGVRDGLNLSRKWWGSWKALVN